MELFKLRALFLREQLGAAELRVAVGGGLPKGALEKLHADVAASLSNSHPSLHVGPSRTGWIVIRGDVIAIRGVLEKVETLISRSGATCTIEDELLIEMLTHDNQIMLSEDLSILSQRFCIVVDLCCPPHEDDSIVLVGDPSRMRDATKELREVLSFHGIKPISNDRAKDHNACAIEDTLHEAEDLEREVFKSEQKITTRAIEDSLHGDEDLGA